MVEIAVDGGKRRLGEISIGVNEGEASQTSKNGEEERREEEKGTTHGQWNDKEKKRNADAAGPGQVSVIIFISYFLGRRNSQKKIK